MTPEELKQKYPEIAEEYRQNHNLSYPPQDGLHGALALLEWLEKYKKRRKGERE